MEELRIQVAGPLTDTELSRAGQRLRAELLVLDVDDVTTPRGEKPEPGAKSGALATIGLLLVSGAPTVLPAVVDVALGWLRRQPIDVELEIGGHRFKGTVTKAQRDELVRTFVRASGGS